MTEETPRPATGTTTKRHHVYTPDLRFLGRTDYSITGGTTSLLRRVEPVWFGSLPVAQIDYNDLSTLRYTFTDHLGAPILQTTATGTIVWQVDREPYGRVWRIRAGTLSAQPLHLPGQEVATERELYNVFRWYRAGWGRYTQVDPIGFNGGTNLYAYVGGNPINASDPLGLKAELVCRPVKPGGWAGVAIGVVGFFSGVKPLHCRLRVTCPCSDGQGDPKAPFDKTVGWENITGQGLTLTQDESLAVGYDDGFFGPWFPVPVQSKASGCDFERCVLSLHKNMGSHLPPYNILGPNSNSYVSHLIKSCGGSANFPPNAIGGSPNPWYSGGGFN